MSAPAQVKEGLITRAVADQFATSKTEDVADLSKSDSATRQEGDSNDNACVGKSESGSQSLDAKFIRTTLKYRQQRARYFNCDLFSDPAWDMLLDLAAAREEGSQVCVSSLCIASGVPPTTALRWINAMIDSALVYRTADEKDKRRAYISITDQAVETIEKYYADRKAEQTYPL